MTTIRTRKKRNPYAVIDKTPLLDSRLTWQARGVIAYLLSKPDDWSANIKDLVNQSPDIRGQGKEAIQAVLKELEGAGYILRRRVQDNSGRFKGWETLVFETPEDRLEWERSTDSGLNPSSGSTDEGLNRQSVEPDDGLSRPLLINELSIPINDPTNAGEGVVEQDPTESAKPSAAVTHPARQMEARLTGEMNNQAEWVASRAGYTYRYKPSMIAAVIKYLSGLPRWIQAGQRATQGDAIRWLNAANFDTADGNKRRLDAQSIWEEISQNGESPAATPRPKLVPLDVPRDPVAYQAMLRQQLDQKWAQRQQESSHGH